MTEDTYKTITEVSEGTYTEKRSKFIAIALPVRTLEEIKVHLEAYQKKYYDARHVCYAYMLGHERKNFRANDNGEPSGTAGKPILGQINSNELTDILIIVVRYFGEVCHHSSQSPDTPPISTIHFLPVHLQCGQSPLSPAGTLNGALPTAGYEVSCCNPYHTTETESPVPPPLQSA